MPQNHGDAVGPQGHRSGTLLSISLTLSRGSGVPGGGANAPRRMRCTKSQALSTWSHGQPPQCKQIGLQDLCGCLHSPRCPWFRGCNLSHYALDARLVGRVVVNGGGVFASAREGTVPQDPGNHEPDKNTDRKGLAAAQGGRGSAGTSSAPCS